MTEVITDIPDQLTDGTPKDVSLYERLGGIYGIAAAVDNLVDRLYVNGAANANPKVAEFHAKQGHAGFKFLAGSGSRGRRGARPRRSLPGSRVESLRRRHGRHRAPPHRSGRAASRRH